jgi:hypothetical protein
MNHHSNKDAKSSVHLVHPHKSLNIFPGIPHIATNKAVLESPPSALLNRMCISHMPFNSLDHHCNVHPKNSIHLMEAEAFPTFDSPSLPTGNAREKFFCPTTTTPATPPPSTDYNPLIVAQKLMTNALQQLQEFYNAAGKEE